ncbi:MAG: hypothetical protein KAT56_00100 [Sedimentisphaerales bacterium]|nr:hypothetical protein [Sedimentisphaerales bacterium]
MKEKNKRNLVLVSILTVLLVSLCHESKAADYTIENDAIKRVISVDTTVKTVSLSNKLTGRTYKVTSDEFKVVLDDTDFDFKGTVLTARDFVPDGKVSVLDGGKKLIVPLKNKAHNLKVKVIYEADGSFYMHKWLEFSTISGSKTISIIEVERMIINGAATSRPNAEGSKQGEADDGPIYADYFWMGVEFPKFYNDFDGDYIRLYHYPNKVASVTNTVKSYKAVLGAANDDWKGDIRSNPIKDSFFKYISELRSTPTRFHRTYNLWCTCPAKEKDVLRIIKSDIAPLYKAGLTFDTITIDHRWEDKRSPTSGWYPAKEKWPNGFGRVQAELAKYGATLDIWMPINMNAPVPIGSDAHRHMKERFTHYTREGITGFKMDFAFFTRLWPYNKKYKGKKKYAMLEASNEGVFDIVRACRKINPDVVFYLTSAINRSPWWLMELNYIWERSTDFQEYRDEWHYTDCLLQHIPQNSWMHMGIPGPNTVNERFSKPGNYWTSRQEMLKAEKYSPVDYVFRGSMFFEVYARFSGTAIPMIVDLARFNKNNFDILTQQPFVSGCTDMYYWAFFHKEKGGLIKFRNRAEAAKNMTIKLDETIRITKNPGTGFELWKVDISPYKETRYKPGKFYYGDTFDVTMPATTVPLIVRLKPVSEL